MLQVITYAMASHSYIDEVSAGNATKATISGLVAGTTYFFVATAYDIASSFTNSVTLGLNGRILSSDSNRLSLSISRLSGTFKGSATDPSTGGSLSFRGAVLQKLNADYGYLLGTNQNRRVIIARKYFLQF